MEIKNFCFEFRSTSALQSQSQFVLTVFTETFLKINFIFFFKLNRNGNYFVNLLWLKYVISFATMHVFRVQT